MSTDVLVSVGMPVYNGQATVAAAISSVLAQTMGKFELIISDNASTDGTQAICEAFAAKDARIRYIRQPTNIGGSANFAFVLDAASAPLFMWAAADDERTPEFLERTMALMTPSEVVSAAAISLYEGQPKSAAVWCPITGSTPGARLLEFLKIGWRSPPLFYGLHRTEILRQCPIPIGAYAAADWSVILHMAMRGKMLMTNQARITLGASGASQSVDKWKASRTSPVELLVPLYRFSIYAMRQSGGTSIATQVMAFMAVARLNFEAFYDMAFSALYQFYKRNFRRYLKRA